MGTTSLSPSSPEPETTPPLVLNIMARAPRLFFLPGAILATAPFLLLAFVISLFTTFGRHVSADYLSVIPLIIPVMFLAALLEARNVVARAIAEEPLLPGEIRVARSGFATLCLLFLVTEGVALWPVATNGPSTFTVLVPLLGAVQLIVLMLYDLPDGLGLTPSLHAMARRYDARLHALFLRLADDLDRRADDQGAKAEEWKQQAAEIRQALKGDTSASDSPTT